MALRAEVTANSECELITTTVATGKTTVAGYPVKRSGADKYVEKMAADNDDVYGIALDTCTAGQTCRVALFGYGIVKCLVGTGGATEGVTAGYAADGLTDLTVGGGQNKCTKCGTFMQTGAAVDYVGLNLASNTGPSVNA